jgi:hypothetical protein
VIIADMRSSMVAAETAAAIGCAFSGASRRIYGVAATPSDTVRKKAPARIYFGA